MSESYHAAVIVGAGLAGVSAAESFRRVDPAASLLLVGRESWPPYHRPPLSKKLWFGKQRMEDIFVQDLGFFERNAVDLRLGVDIAGLDRETRTLVDADGRRYRYGKLLLATGGRPRRLTIPGGELEGIFYYRYLADYVRLRRTVTEGQKVLVIGGGFIGSEMAAALKQAGREVTIIFPGSTLASRVLPADLGRALVEQFRQRGIEVLDQDTPIAIEQGGERYVTRTRNGKVIESNAVLAGVGIAPHLELAKQAGLQIGDGIVVDATLRTDDPYIYAAGDNALFPSADLGRSIRVEHWDNALEQGRLAGRNLAGASESYTHLPYFFSDLFEFGYEAVGDVDARLETISDWEKPFEKGVIYYLRDGVVRGALMCNVWDKVDAARQLIRENRPAAELRGAIR